MLRFIFFVEIETIVKGEFLQLGRFFPDVFLEFDRLFDSLPQKLKPVFCTFSARFITFAIESGPPGQLRKFFLGPVRTS